MLLDFRGVTVTVIWPPGFRMPKGDTGAIGKSGKVVQGFGDPLITDNGDSIQSIKYLFKILMS